ncbi:TetR/AcrR family transcriptional regulator [Nocardiopsis sp. NPDC049922]|uniref:TetR/AcrR family transcriptional regulator n=1 Tax=Nocardiopsis sp. NPDC049922 TaxID=3155157 RepID=UPI00340C3171
MPKRVDHQQRRVQIAEAVCALVSARGLEAASLRDVAAQAGVSMGRVQHYFRTKGEMLAFTLEYAGERDMARVRASLEERPGPLSPREVVRVILGGLLGEESRRVDGLRVGVAFQARALVEPELARRVHRAYSGVRETLEYLIRRGIDGGPTRAETDPGLEAAALLALVEGMRAQRLLGQVTEEEAARVLDSRLDALFVD